MVALCTGHAAPSPVTPPVDKKSRWGGVEPVSVACAELERNLNPQDGRSLFPFMLKGEPAETRARTCVLTPRRPGPSQTHTSHAR